MKEHNKKEKGKKSPSLSLLHGKRILIVEDDEAQRYFLEIILSNLGMKTFLAASGKIALETLDTEESFDLILMDWSMPRMDGIETTRAICDLRKKHNSPHIPIIGFTGSDDPHGKDLCIAAGMDDYLHKNIWRPRWQEHLQDSLAQWIDPQKRKECLLHTQKIRKKAIQSTKALIPEKMAKHRSKAADTESFSSMVFDYIKRAETCLLNINDAACTNDTELLLENARALKSSSRVTGLISVFDAAKTLENYVKAAEKNGKKLNPLTLQEKIMRLEDIFQRAEYTLKNSVKT